MSRQLSSDWKLAKRQKSSVSQFKSHDSHPTVPPLQPAGKQRTRASLLCSAGRAGKPIHSLPYASWTENFLPGSEWGGGGKANATCVHCFEQYNGYASHKQQPATQEKNNEITRYPLHWHSYAATKRQTPSCINQPCRQSHLQQNTTSVDFDFLRICPTQTRARQTSPPALHTLPT